VHNGKIYSDDTEVQRRITAPRPLDGEVSDYETKDNVIRVKSILTEAQWDHLFPYRDDVYTYDGFLNAVGKFPAFCTQNNRKDEWTDVDMCKKELATLFAHFVQETSFNSQWHANNHEFVDMFR
jgi:chitodextrinase